MARARYATRPRIVISRHWASVITSTRRRWRTSFLPNARTTQSTPQSGSPPQSRPARSPERRCSTCPAPRRASASPPSCPRPANPGPAQQPSQPIPRRGLRSPGTRSAVRLASPTAPLLAYGLPDDSQRPPKQRMRKRPQSNGNQYRPPRRIPSHLQQGARRVRRFPTETHGREQRQPADHQQHGPLRQITDACDPVGPGLRPTDRSRRSPRRCLKRPGLSPPEFHERNVRVMPAMSMQLELRA